MRRVKVSRSFQITIPADVRKLIGINIGDILSVSIVENKIILEKVEDRLLSFKIRRKIGEREIMEALLKGIRRSLVGD